MGNANVVKIIANRVESHVGDWFAEGGEDGVRTGIIDAINDAGSFDVEERTRLVDAVLDAIGFERMPSAPDSKR